MSSYLAASPTQLTDPNVNHPFYMIADSLGEHRTCPPGGCYRNPVANGSNFGYRQTGGSLGKP